MKKITQKEVEQRIQQRFPNESFKILDYHSLGKPGKVQCLNCGKVIEIKAFGNFMAPSKRYGCSSCQSNYVIQRKKNLELLQKYYEILETTVVDTHTVYTVKCKECGHIRRANLRNLAQHLKCGCKTNVKRHRTAEEFINEVNNYSKIGTYKLIGEYVNQTTPVLLQHNCGFIWKVRPGDVIHGRSTCPKCGRKRSKNALYIEQLLKESGVKFEVERLLKNSRQRFDFYLENDKYKIAIEYNGEQHYVENNYFYVTLAEQQERDERKRQYCKVNGIILYEIPYTYSKTEIAKLIQQIINKFND